MRSDSATFLTVNGKRRVLVVDDEAINREILATMLDDEYEVLFAEDGEQAMRQVWAHKQTLSIALLDLIMPNMPGQEVLRRIKEAPELRDIPVIVVTADFSQEIVCLDAGASDFIQKPYPSPGVVRARVRRTIELSEDRQIIQSAERDPLTGLYNLEFFYSYAEQYDLHHKDAPTDAIVVDISHFSMVNERFGRAYADEVLRKVGKQMRSLVHDDGGIVSRSGGDVFQVYCPHREDYKAMLDSITANLVDEQNANRPIRLRMGVYSNVDKSLSVERRFDRAKMAAGTVRDSYTRSIGVYDDALLKSELYSQRLMDDFGTGYSSLNMLATLPIDALKLDMRFVRTAFAQEGDSDTHMIKVVIDIAFHLSVPVIAEGVETEEQLNALRDLGCDTVQGYYFSEPVPPSKFGRFLQEGKLAAEEAQIAARNAEQKIGAGPKTQKKEGEARKWWERLPAVSLRTSRIWFVVAALIVAVALLASEFMLFRGYARNEEASERYIAAQRATSDMEMGSDWLTENVRSFVVTGNIAYMDEYFKELEVTKRRDTAVETVKDLLEIIPEGKEAYESLNTALSNSNELVNLEYEAMRLVLDVGDYDGARIPQQLRNFDLGDESEQLTDDEKIQKARQLVFGPEYAAYKDS